MHQFKKSGIQDLVRFVPRRGRLECQGCSACEEVARLSVFAPSMFRHIVVVVDGVVVDNLYHRPLV